MVSKSKSTPHSKANDLVIPEGLPPVELTENSFNRSILTDFCDYEKGLIAKMVY